MTEKPTALDAAKQHLDYVRSFEVLSDEDRDFLYDATRRYLIELVRSQRAADDADRIETATYNRAVDDAVRQLLDTEGCDA